MMTNPPHRRAAGSQDRATGMVARGFTLVELLVVVVVLGTIAVLVVPQFSDAGERTAAASTSRQLQMLRSQIELFRNQTGRDPDLLNTQWDDLVHNDYLISVPFNLRNRCSTVAATPSPGVGWVWRDKGNGTFALYATDETFLAELSE